MTQITLDGVQDLRRDTSRGRGVRLGLSAPREWIDWLDEARGDQPRSPFIRRAVEIGVAAARDEQEGE